MASIIGFKRIISARHDLHPYPILAWNEKEGVLPPVETHIKPKGGHPDAARASNGEKCIAGFARDQGL